MAKRSRAVMRPLMGLAVERGHLPRTPSDGVKLAAPTEDADSDPDLVLSPLEVLDLCEEVEAYEPAWAPLVLPCGLSGLRPGEAAVVRRGDLDLPAEGTGRTVGRTAPAGSSITGRLGRSPRPAGVS